MKKVYKKLQNEAVKIAERYPGPDFYRDFGREVSRSKRFFAKDGVICDLWGLVAQNIENDYGHGLEHVRSVALDAGALMLIESASDNCTDEQLEDRMRMAQAAGLLHDIRRKEKDHAAAGAEFAGRVLPEYGFSARHTEAVCLAIGNHEAFGRNVRGDGKVSCLVSDCLYDADKFRWGPENFTSTLWAMLSYMDVPPEKFMAHYPRGMRFLHRIRDTFRTPTGRSYGPRIIDLGLAIGEELRELIERKCTEHPGY